MPAETRLSVGHPVSQWKAGDSRGEVLSRMVSEAIIFSTALDSSNGQSWTGRTPTGSGRPKRSTGMRSSTTTCRHSFMTKQRTMYLPEGLMVGRPEALSLG